MELIDRYVHEFGRRLPRKQRSDIQAELRSLLLDSLDPDNNGEELSEERVVSVLKEFGSPAQVAASYSPQNQYLIGPTLYPFFRMVVAIVISALVGAMLLALGIEVVFSQEALVLPEPLRLLDFFSDLFGGVISAFGMVVLVFVILERFGVKPELENEDWDPRDLPVIDETGAVSRRGTLVGIAFGLVILALLWFFPDKIGFVVTFGDEIITNPVIVQYIPLISVSLLLGIGLDLFLIWHGRWEMGTRLAKIGVNLFSIYVLYVLVGGHAAWLAQRGQNGFFSSLESLSNGMATNMEVVQLVGMHAFRLAFVIAMIVVSIETVTLLYRLVRQFIAPPLKIEPASASKSSN